MEEFSEIIEKKLLKDEKILWNGKPENTMSSRDISIIFACIFIVGFILYIELGVVLRTGIDLRNKIGYMPNRIYAGFIILSAFAIFVIIYAVDAVIGKKYIKGKTVYIVTDKRVIVFICTKYPKVIEKNISNITKVEISELLQFGQGTLIFGEAFLNSLYVRDGKRERAKRYSHVGDIPIFNNIYDAKKVYELVNNLRNKI